MCAPQRVQPKRQVQELSNLNVLFFISYLLYVLPFIFSLRYEVEVDFLFLFPHHRGACSIQHMLLTTIDCWE